MPPGMNSPFLSRYYIKHFSSTPWRIKSQQHQLISQISTILLQRHNWSSLLLPLNLSLTLTPQLFLQILHKTHSNPQASLEFFTWAKSHLGFQPDLKTHCKITQIAAGLDETRPVKPILDSFIGVDPPDRVVHSLIQACKGTDFHSKVFSLVIECYAQKGFYFDGLFVYRKIVSSGWLPQVSCLNKVLDVLERAGEFRLVYCLYASMLRNRVLCDMSTLTIMARVLCKTRRFERVVRLLELGVCNSVVSGLLVDWYSHIGDFGAAFDHVNEMCRRNLDPGFGIYGSILDGACKCRDSNVIEMAVDAMKEKKLLPENLTAEYDVVIKKFCDLGKMYAAELFFEQARNEGVGLEDPTFGYLLRAFSKGGRVNEAILFHNIISNENVLVKKSVYLDLTSSLCKGNPSDEAAHLLVDLIKRGFNPCVSELSMFIMKLGRREKWKEIEELINVMLHAGLMPDSGCCRLLIEHYYNSGQTDSSLLLHNKSEEFETLWDVKTYNVLLRALITEKRVDDAFEVFDCMRRKGVVSRASFIVMISGLSQAKEMRKAMEVHDEMLRLGLKPGSKTYKNLISVFR